MSSGDTDTGERPPDAFPGDRADRRENLFFLLVVLAVTVLAYGPLVLGVFRLSTRTTQAVNAFLLLGFAFLDALRTTWKAQPLRLAINAHGLVLFALSCTTLLLASLLSMWPLAVLGLCLNVGALLSFCFGRGGVKPFYPALAGFGATVGLLVFVPQADRALRLLAAGFSSRALKLFDLRTDLVMRADPFQVMLVVEKGAGVFDVATECNGVGILLSSVVLALILGLRRRLPGVRLALLLAAAVGVGLCFNTVRIVAIMLASLRTDVDYGLIHEGLGTVVYLAGLAVVYVIARLSSGVTRSTRLRGAMR